MKCFAVMSLPRLCLTDNIFCAIRAFSTLDIPLIKGGRVYWEQGLSRSLQRAIDEGFDVAFVLDYDSVFGLSHVQAMLDIMTECDWVDFLVPLQSKRYSTNEILFRRLFQSRTNAMFVCHVLRPGTSD